MFHGCLLYRQDHRFLGISSLNSHTYNMVVYLNLQIKKCTYMYQPYRDMTHSINQLVTIVITFYVIV